MKKTFTSAKEIFHYIIASLINHDPREASSISFLILEHLGISKADVLSGKLQNFTVGEKLENIITRLNQSEPIQYILGEADFYDLKFTVNSSVLIPRSETEELVHLIIKENKAKDNLKILDIGTGSGCIAITLAKDLSNASVSALDKSIDALEVAKKNSIANNASVDFYHSDILNITSSDLPMFDVIVSNPPYVRNSEKAEMQKNVLNYEPEMALFVEDTDPLIFYRAICSFAKSNLLPNGILYFEINEYLGSEMDALLKSFGFKEVKTIKDLHGRNRITKGIKG